jgi:hypothetical protein
VIPPLVRPARAMAAELVEARTGRAVDVDVHFKLPDDVRVTVDHARATTAEAKRLAAVAAEEHRQAVRDQVVDRGMSKTGAAARLQVVQQRISQCAPQSAGGLAQAPKLDQAAAGLGAVSPTRQHCYVRGQGCPPPLGGLERRAGKGRSPTSPLAAVHSLRGYERGGRPRRVAVDAP